MNTQEVGYSPSRVYHHRNEIDAVKNLFNSVLPNGETSWYEVADDYYNSLYDSAYIDNKVELDINDGIVRVKEI